MDEADAVEVCGRCRRRTEIKLWARHLPRTKAGLLAMRIDGTQPCCTLPPIPCSVTPKTPRIALPMRSPSYGVRVEPTPSRAEIYAAFWSFAFGTKPSRVDGARLVRFA